SGWQAAELVTLVLHEEPTIDSDLTLYAAADDVGNIFNNQFSTDIHDVGVTFTLTATGGASGLTAQATFTDNPSVEIDQCGNGPLSAPVPCTGAAWQNGNLNENQAHYLEGDSVPYREVFSSLTAGGTFSMTIGYDTIVSGKHALDYLTTFNRTEATADPCSDILSAIVCSSPSTAPIPLAPNAVNQALGVFTLYNGTITSVSGYTVSTKNNG